MKKHIDRAHTHDLYWTKYSGEIVDIAYVRREIRKRLRAWCLFEYAANRDAILDRLCSDEWLCGTHGCVVSFVVECAKSTFRDSIVFFNEEV